MENTWGGPGRAEPDRDPVRISKAETAFVSIGSTSLAVAVLLALLDNLGSLTVPIGMYPLVGTCVGTGFLGWAIVWAVGCAERRIMHRVGPEHEELRHQLVELTSEVQALSIVIAQSRSVHLPPTKRHEGVRYLSAAVGGQGDTVAMVQRTGIDPESIAAARTLARRLIDGPTGEVPAQHDRE